MKLSVVLPTLNRLPYLQAALESIPPAAGELWPETEVIVVDGGSTDGTLEFLRTQDLHLHLIEQGRKLGSVVAFNAGFAVARGDYVAHLNDDAAYVGATLLRACQYLEAHPECGQVALPYRENERPAQTYDMWLGGRGGVRVRYANFGVTRRELGERLGWWGDYVHYAGDNELSANIWLAGYTVDELPDGLVQHYCVQDETRHANDAGGSRRFYQKWDRVDVSALKRRLSK